MSIAGTKKNTINASKEVRSKNKIYTAAHCRQHGTSALIFCSPFQPQYQAFLTLAHRSEENFQTCAIQQRGVSVYSGWDERLLWLGWGTRRAQCGRCDLLLLR